INKEAVMKRRRVLTVMGGAMVGVLVLVLVTVGLVGLAQAVQHRVHRFIVLPPDQLGAVWVLDTTTALRWQKTPDTNQLQWVAASQHCTDMQHGSRLPEIKELISLVDYSKADPALPEGHPFQARPAGHYWSATPVVLFPDTAWAVEIGEGNVLGFTKTRDIPAAWCVR